jgi:ferredoxin
MYKREEDGIVLVDQNKCRGWRYCVSGCPYKKVYFNHRTGKAEKCTLCYPRIEVGQPTICSETCVGRIRYLGLVPYDADRVQEAASVPDERDLLAAQRDVFLDPEDPAVRAAARRDGIPDDWLDAARRSPICDLAMRWGVALPLHPEFRTLPMVWYLPPLSPVVSTLEIDGYEADPDDVFGAIDHLRIPLEYLANLLAAGDVEQIRAVLHRLAAMHAYMRKRAVLGEPARPARPGSAGRRRPVGLRDLGDGRRARPARLAHAHPVGMAQRPLRRPTRVHPADGVHAAAADRARRLARLPRHHPRLRLSAGLRRCVVRRRRAVRGRLVRERAPGLRAWRLRRRHGGHRARGAHRAADRRPVGVGGAVLGGDRGRRRHQRRLLGERTRRAAGSGDGAGAGHVAALSVFRTSGRAWALTLFYFLAFGGFVAMFLYLPKLLTAEYDLTKADAGARAAGFALLAVVGRPLGGWLSDRVGASRVLLVSFKAVAVLALVLAAAYTAMVPLTIACLTMAVALGLGTGAVFKLVPEWFPDRVGSVTGVVGAAGGLGGFFPPLVMGIVKSATGAYGLGFVLMSLVALACLVVLRALGAPQRGARGRPRVSTAGR